MIFAEAVFVLLLLAAAASDVTYYRIPNSVVLALGAAFVIWAAVDLAPAAWLGHLGAGMLCLAGGFAFYQFGQMGAGDVKLFAAVALWTGMSGLVLLLVLVSLSGLVTLPLLLLARHLVIRAQRAQFWNARWPLPRVLTKGQGVPYGLAIALGGLLTMALSPGSLR